MNKFQHKILDNLGEDEVEAMSHGKSTTSLSHLFCIFVHGHLYCAIPTEICHRSFCNNSSLTLNLPADHRLYPGVEGRISPDLIRLLPWWELHLQKQIELAKMISLK